jgi:hypothetical protein
MTRNGQRIDGDGEKEREKEKMEEMEKTMKRGRNHSVMEGIEVEGID